jgi:hypothetical protein
MKMVRICSTAIRAITTVTVYICILMVERFLTINTASTFAFIYKEIAPFARFILFLFLLFRIA